MCGDMWFTVGVRGRGNCWMMTLTKPCSEDRAHGGIAIYSHVPDYYPVGKSEPPGRVVYMTSSHSPNADDYN